MDGWNLRNWLRNDRDDRHRAGFLQVGLEAQNGYLLFLVAAARLEALLGHRVALREERTRVEWVIELTPWLSNRDDLRTGLPRLARLRKLVENGVELLLRDLEISAGAMLLHVLEPLVVALNLLKRFRLYLGCHAQRRREARLAVLN